MNRIQKELFSLQDKKYQEFQSKLIPNIDSKTVIGVRMPVLRKYSKTLKEQEIVAFMECLPHDYYEENNLHMMLISSIQDYLTCVQTLNDFLPYVDNWATCDLPIPKCFNKNKKSLLKEINIWIHSDHTYTIRYGIGLLMRLYLDEDFQEEYVKQVCSIQSEEYYVNMMIAWYLATALAKQWDYAIPYLEKRELNEFVHQKTIQKAIESYRISKEQKEYLKTLK